MEPLSSMSGRGSFAFSVMSAMKELNISTDNGCIFGMAMGEADAPLLLGIHGWSQRNGWHTWQPMMEPLSAAGFRVVCLDMPGWGRSDPWGNGPLGVEDAIDALLAVQDDLGSESTFLMGKSWGGGIAITMALNHPARVEKLILTAPAFREMGSLSVLSQPALMAWAEDDPVIPYRYAELYVQSAPSIELVTYATGGHSAGPKNAEDFAPRVIRFLSTTESR
jgi:pimeloyl-ACP methyl ester carboxylesterase